MSEEERQWLAAHAEQFILAPTPDFPPLEIIDEQGRFTGYAGDLFRHLEARLGVRFRVVNLKTWDAIIQAGQRREIALTSLAQRTAEREAWWSFTSPLLEVPTVIITSQRIRGTLRLEDLRSLRVGVVQSFAVSEYLNQMAPGLTLINLDSERAGLHQVSMGELDALITILPPAVFHIQKEGLTNLRVAGEIGYVYRFCIASRNDWPVLGRLLQRALDAIPEAERRALFDRWIHVEVEPAIHPRTLLLACGSALGLVLLVILWNRSLRREVERRLREIREREEQYRTLFEHASDGILLSEPGHGVTDCNSQALAMFRATREQILGRSPHQFSPECQPSGERSEDLARARLAGARAGAGQFFHWRHRRFDGTEFDAEVSLNAFATGSRERFLSVVRDVTERQRAERELRQHEENFRAIFETVPQAIAINRLADGSYVAANPAFLETVGLAREAVLGRPLGRLEAAVVQVPTPAMVDRARAETTIDNVSLVGADPDGSPRHFLASARLMTFHGEPCLLSITVDVTATRRLEEDLRQAQKMDVVGQLAGGIAHDFNNMLTGILGYAEILQVRVGPDPKVQATVESIKEGARRAADLTRKLLAFSRKGTLKASPIDVHGPLQAAISLLKHSIDKRIVIETRFQANPGTIVGDATLLQNTFLNLGLNARDAMPEGGTLSFSTRTVVCDSEVDHPFPPGGYVEIAIRDTGLGIPREILPRIFDPFFTTKDHGKGTGLGLTVAFKTVKDHRGGIQVASEPGRGSTFTVLLPVSMQPLPAGNQDAPAPVPGKGRILVIDDEAEVRAVMDAHLRHLGYEVELAADGQEGLAACQRSPAGFDLVITDMIMPRVDGRQVLERLRAIAPALRVVVCSGFHHEGNVEEILALGAIAFLHKPFDLTELSQVVAQSLACPGALGSPPT
ncbi:MAG: PAS domain S-box protein [Candidatus Riflebacteria bacterium]|nr:PAS domain S-box protein [Candidatus Riflebacteria bacterium]